MTEMETETTGTATTNATAVDAEAVHRPQRAAEAREAASAFIATLYPAPPVGTVQNLLLLVSELVTNAIRHAGAVTALSFSATRTALQVRVADPSPAHPQQRVPDLTGRTGGFGWPMVLRLARHVDIRVSPDHGKIILASLPR